MPKEMLINVSEGEECRIALVEDGVLQELYMERTSSTSHVGNVYKGKVQNVEPSIQAAFVDFGLGRNGFLHISDLLPSYFGRRGDDVQEFVGKKMARRDRPPIQRCLRRGDEIIVQVIKEGIGTKGPTLSAYLSISGKMLVMMPGVNGRGVSRKIEDEEERRRLKQILVSLDPPEDCGFIIRTESVGKSKVEIERDLKYLSRLWEQIKKKRDNNPAPVELYTEGDLVTRTVRDVFSGDVDRIIIDNADVADRVHDVLKLSNPRAKNKVELYEEPIPLLHKWGIEREIEQMYSRHVPLRNGGSLVIDSTEAIVAIDVNSGKNRENSDAEMTAFNTDMEAADEICRQLKLRDLGGVIICDFIDLRYERHRRELEERLHENLKNDRAKTKVLRMSQFGIIEMTRQRMRPSLKRSVYFDCPHCKGAGLVKTPESMSLDVMRRLAIAIYDSRVIRVELAINPDVAFYLQNKKRQALANLEYDTRKQILIKSDSALGLDEMRLNLFDARDGVVIIDELAGTQESVPHKTQLNTRPQAIVSRQPRQGGARGEERRPGQRPPQSARRDEREDEREAFDKDVEELESRTDDFDRESEEGEDVSSADSNSHSFSRRPSPSLDGDEDRDADADSGERKTESRADDRGAGVNGTPRPGQHVGDDQNGEGGQRRRRRRRRRGRGRNRGEQGSLQNEANAPGGAEGRDRRPMDDNGESANADLDDEREESADDEDRDTRFERDERDRDVPRGRDDRDTREAPMDRDAVERDFDSERDHSDDEEHTSLIDRDDRPIGDDEDEEDGNDEMGREDAEEHTTLIDRDERPVGDDRPVHRNRGESDRPRHDRRDDGHRDREDRQRQSREDIEDREFDLELRDIHSRSTQSESPSDTTPAISASETPRDASPLPEASLNTSEVDEAQVPAETKPKRGRRGSGRGKKKPETAGEVQDVKRTAKVKAPARGKKPAAKPAVPEKADVDEPAEESELAGKASGKRRRGSRGGRGRGRAKSAGAAESEASTASTPSPKPSSASMSAPAVVPEVVRTGSTDSHLADEEPVHHEPVRRPRSYRDLDQIPDDYD